MEINEPSIVLISHCRGLVKIVGKIDISGKYSVMYVRIAKITVLELSVTISFPK